MNPVFPHEDGMLLVVEGPDCSGKTTLVSALESYMRATGEFVPVVKHFPTRGPIGKVIRDVWEGKAVENMNAGSTDQAEAQHQKFDHTMPWLHAADQLAEEEDTTRALNEKRTVIYDRHHLVSSWAYQIDSHTIERLLAVGQAQGFRRPDMVFLMDVPPEELLSRLEAKRSRGEPINRMYEHANIDRVEMLCNRYAAYAIMHRENCVTLNGLESPEDNAKKVVETVKMLRDMYADLLHQIKE